MEILNEIATTPAEARDRLRVQESPSVLIEALGQAEDERARRIICDVLGHRHEHSAVDALISSLNDVSSSVRSAAADALAKIGDPRAGLALLARVQLPDDSVGVRRMLLAALGAVKFREAIPMLIDWLQNPDAGQRGAAAWSLGAMNAKEALGALESALRVERIPYPKEQMRSAIETLRQSTGSASD